MTRRFDAVVVGAGPAGMSAAIRMTSLGLSVLVVDEQSAPGGQIWRAVEAVAETQVGAMLGEEYQAGARLAERFRICGVTYEPRTQVWQIEPGWRIYTKRDGHVEIVRAEQVVIATGAQERPAPFPGWDLPGVLTVGAAQILLKTSRQVPADPVWVAGNGPLPLLYMAQLLRAGGKIAGWLDTSPQNGWWRALPWAGSALRDRAEILKGLGWMREIRRAGVLRVRGVTSLRACGVGRLQELEFSQGQGHPQRVRASLLLSHEGVVPSIHMTQALGCAHRWDPQQLCLAPVLDDWGQSTVEGVFVAGDGAGIGGAKAACVRGEIVGLAVARRAGRISSEQSANEARPLRDHLRKLLRLRPMLDSLYAPRSEIFSPSDNTIVCRCEELTAGDIRNACSIGSPGVNQVKAMTRAGMGPCQGRQCGYTVANIVASVKGCDVSDVGFYRIRPPLKPVTVGDLASINIEEDES
ncbi:NAD(P)/FAD-dependent oxidoreductase [Caballeronia sp. GACF5]|uniref:FAD/NAD(P)-dependent oxidoreductase n=1 Tax=Caballeronia sp. GACF5 TaxID=2921746 RepID=UPI00253F9BE6|nr:NAD(P)/FAD-dependent oxidoreductase [Caballeronia sp. GACF5]